MSSANPRSAVLTLALAHRSEIMSLILAMVRNPVTAEDLFQESMVAIAESAERYDPARDFRLWAKGIARNMVRRHWQATAREVPVSTAAALDYLANLAAPEANDTWEQERLALRRCLEKLEGRNRELIRLRYANHLLGPQLAKEIGMQPGALRTTLARIRRKLRTCIEDHLATDPVQA